MIPLIDKNEIVIACAGGRKTTSIVKEALSVKNERVLITTYTIENAEQIKSYIIKEVGCIPENIDVKTWFTFLLHDCLRPYQNHTIANRKIKSIDFVSKPHWGKSKNQESYFLNMNDDVYQDKVSDLACLMNVNSKGLVIKRLEKIYRYIFVDEMQDMNGWDLDFFEFLLNSDIKIKLVGDPRQCLYNTNRSSKNKGRKRENIIVWINKMKQNNICSLKEISDNFRSKQEICDFANLIFPDYSPSVSKNNEVSNHVGVYIITDNELSNYINSYHSVLLRNSISTDTCGFDSCNIGISKGKGFDHIIIFPTNPMVKFLKSGNVDDVGSRAKLYVAITRARYSVAFVLRKRQINSISPIFTIENLTKNSITQLGLFS